MTDFDESLKKNGENLAPYVDGSMAHRGTGITGNRFPAASALKFVRAGKWLEASLVVACSLSLPSRAVGRVRVHSNLVLGGVFSVVVFVDGGFCFVWG